MLITASVNEGSSIKEINASIRRLQGQVRKIDLGFNLGKADIKAFKDITKQFANLNKEALNTKKVIETALFPDGTNVKREYFGGLKGEFSELVKTANQASDSMKKSSGAVTESAKQTKVLNAELNKSYEITKKTVAENAKGVRTTTEAYKSAETGATLLLKRNQHGEIVSRKATQNIQQQNAEREKALRYEQTVRNQIEKTRIAEERKTKELREQLALYQRQASLNKQNIVRTHGTSVNKGDLSDWSRQVQSLSSTTPHLDSRMKDLNMRFREISGSAKSAAGALQQSGMSLSEMMSNALVKVPLWGIATGAIYGTISAARSLVDTLIEIDTQMVTLSRVSNGEINITKVLSDSFEIADRLGNKLQEVNEAFVG